MQKNGRKRPVGTDRGTSHKLSYLLEFFCHFFTQTTNKNIETIHVKINIINTPSPQKSVVVTWRIVYLWSLFFSTKAYQLAFFSAVSQPVDWRSIPSLTSWMTTGGWAWRASTWTRPRGTTLTDTTTPTTRRAIQMPSAGIFYRCVHISVLDPWTFGLDPEQRIRASD